MNLVRHACLVPVLLLMGWSSAQIAADDLHLTDGRVIEGEIISAADSETVDIRVRVGGLLAVQHFPKSKVERVVYRVSARQMALNELQQQMAQLKAAPESSASQWWSLATKLSDLGEQALAREIAKQVIVLDRHHADARKLLGQVRFQGVWMRPNEVAVAQGKVLFRGSWVTWPQQEQTLADEARRREEQVAQRKEREEQRRQARISAAIAADAAAASLTALRETYVNQYYRSPYYPAGGYLNHLHVWNGGVCHYPIIRPHCPTGTHWHVGASGGGSNHAWRFGWSTSSSGF
jgi:DNA-binding transcriptional regulator YdaS (Cro superfamily)